MVTVEQRELIAQVPRETLRAIMSLRDPSFDSVDALLPEHQRYLAQPILELLLGDDAVVEPGRDEAEEVVPVAEPVQPGVEKLSMGERLKAAAVVAAQRRFNPAEVFDLDPALLAPYQWGADESAAPGVSFQFLGYSRAGEVDQSPRVELAWDSYGSDPFTFYRVVATDVIDATPNPENNEQLAFTGGLFYEDPVPGNEAFREYQVWAYRGADEYQALNSQPDLVGRALVIFPVRGIKLAPGEGVISGTWAALPGHHSMRVYVSDVKENARPDSPQFQLRDGVQPMRFEYVTPERGVSKRVVLQPEIRRPDGTIMVGQASPMEIVEIKGELSQVEFNDVYRIESENGPMVAFTVYGPPVGDFHVYLTQTRPSPDLTIDDIPKEALSQEGMDTGGNVSYAFGSIGHNLELAQSVYWPQGWDEVFVTPVVTLGGYARVGSSEALHHVDSIDDAEIREFVGYQLVTFGWPRGASMVKVQRQPQGASAEDRETVREFTEEEYREHGGVKLTLENGGEDVVLTPQKYYENQPTRAEETIVSYPGLWKFLYSLYPEAPTADHPGGISVRIWSDGREIMNPPNFAVVYNATRKPLSATALIDGDQAIGASLGGPTFHPSAGTVLIPENHIGSSEERAARWFIPVDGIPGEGFLRVMLVMGEDLAQDQVRHIITDEHTNGGILRQYQIDQMRAPAPPVEYYGEQTDTSGSRRRGLFGRG